MFLSFFLSLTLFFSIFCSHFFTFLIHILIPSPLVTILNKVNLREAEEKRRNKMKNTFSETASVLKWRGKGEILRSPSEIAQLTLLNKNKRETKKKKKQKKNETNVEFFHHLFLFNSWENGKIRRISFLVPIREYHWLLI